MRMIQKVCEEARVMACSVSALLCTATVIFTHTCIYIYNHMCIYIYMYNVYVYIYIYMYIYICIYIYVSCSQCTVGAACFQVIWAGIAEWRTTVGGHWQCALPQKA